VWLARNLVGTPRAVKIVRRDRFEHAADFEREFKGLQCFEPVSRTHEGLSDILTLGRLPGIDGFFYVMELADDANRSSGILSAEAHPPPVISVHSKTNPGQLSLENYSPLTLRAALRNHTVIPFDRLLDLGLKLTAAVAHLHAQGLVHRDIKPSNILFVGGEPKLADAGLVAAVDDARSLVGTAGYIAPEGPGSAQADLYALGKALYEAAFGKDRQDFPQLPPDLRARPDHARLLEFNQIILKACAADPRERYASADEMLSELELLRQGKSVKHKRARSQCLVLVKKLGLLASGLAIIAVTMQQMHLRQGTKSPQSPATKLSQNAEAVRLYEVARWQFNRKPGEGSEKAIQAIESAMALDPQFAQAYVLRFEMCIWTFGVSPHEVSAKAGEIADKLIGFNAALGEAHAARGWSNHCEFNWEESQKELQLAMRLNDNYAMAHALYALILTKQGRFDEARPEFKRAMDLEPTSRALIVIAGFPDLYSRHYSNAIVQFEKALEFEPNSKYAYEFIASTYELAGNYPAAIQAFQRMQLLAGDDPADVARKYDQRRRAYAENGETGYWRDELTTDIANRPHADFQHSAQVYAHLGEKEKALDCLEKAFDTRTYTALWLKVNPAWDPLRDEPRFKAMLRRARFTE
jgi:tetratricopeptide (TPR) repeat protein